MAHRQGHLTLPQERRRMAHRQGPLTHLQERRRMQAPRQGPPTPPQEGRPMQGPLQGPLEPWKETDAEGKAILTGFLIFIVCCIWYYRKGDQKTENPFHRCKCSYNLTGNRSGTCPECGEPILSGSR